MLESFNDYLICKLVKILIIKSVLDLRFSSGIQVNIAAESILLVEITRIIPNNLRHVILFLKCSFVEISRAYNFMFSECRNWDKIIKNILNMFHLKL